MYTIIKVKESVTVFVYNMIILKVNCQGESTNYLWLSINIGVVTFRRNRTIFLSCEVNSITRDISREMTSKEADSFGTPRYKY